MNKNSKRRFATAHDALGRIKHGRAQVGDPDLASTAQGHGRINKHAKVGRSAAEITKRVGPRL